MEKKITIRNIVINIHYEPKYYKNIYLNGEKITYEKLKEHYDDEVVDYKFDGSLKVWTK